MQACIHTVLSLLPTVPDPCLGNGSVHAGCISLPQHNQGAGELTQPLRELVALEEDLDSVPSTCPVALYSRGSAVALFLSQRAERS